MNEDYVTYDTCIEREKMAYDAALDKVIRIIDEHGLSNAYDRPSFWYNKGKDYKVIPTKYHAGYDQALGDIRAAVKALREGGEE